MQIVAEFLGVVQEAIKKQKILTISGESGIGKTTLALQLVGNLLAYKIPSDECCIWVQASENFPMKRLVRMFQKSPEIINYLQDHIFVSPNHTLANYWEQSKLLVQIINHDSILPPNARFLVIDNISHHLRYELSKYNDVAKITSLIDEFYDSQLMPLLMLCQREGLFLILIHEISYDPTTDKNRSFLFKLYDRLNTIKIELDFTSNRSKKVMTISTQEDTCHFFYMLDDRGLVTF